MARGGGVFCFLKIVHSDGIGRRNVNVIELRLRFRVVNDLINVFSVDAARERVPVNFANQTMRAIRGRLAQTQLLQRDFRMALIFRAFQFLEQHGQRIDVCDCFRDRAIFRAQFKRRDLIVNRDSPVTVGVLLFVGGGVTLAMLISRRSLTDDGPPATPPGGYSPRREARRRDTDRDNEWVEL